MNSSGPITATPENGIHILAPTLNPLQRYIQHKNELDRLHLQQEKNNTLKYFQRQQQGKLQQRLEISDKKNIPGGGRVTGKSGGAGGHPPSGVELTFTDTLENGVITEVDYVNKRGTLRSHLAGDASFYFDQCEFGMRKVRVNDQIKFRIDTFRARPFAVEVRPIDVNKAYTDDDIKWFINECLTASIPIHMMRQTLLNRDEWPRFLASVPKNCLNELTTALVHLCTILENTAVPINLKILKEFLDTLAWDDSTYLFAGVPPLSGVSTIGANPGNSGDRIQMDTNGVMRVFPDLVLDMLNGFSATKTTLLNKNMKELPLNDEEGQTNEMKSGVMIASPSSFFSSSTRLHEEADLWLEVAGLIFLYRRFTFLDLSKLRFLGCKLIDLAGSVLDALSSEQQNNKLNIEESNVMLSLRKLTERKLQQVIRRTCVSIGLECPSLSIVGRSPVSPPSENISEAAASMMAAFVPSVKELMYPTWDKRSPFNENNLPVCTEIVYKSTEEYILTQCNLLRADNYSRTINVIGYKMFSDIPVFSNVRVPERIKQDAVCHSFFNNMCFVGHAVSTFADYKHPTSYLFEFEDCTALNERSVNWSTVLDQGTLVCITTGLNRTQIEEGEVFWGIVATLDEGARYHRVVALAQISGNFERLIANLERNRRKGKAETASLMMATNVFFTGFSSVLGGLSMFLGLGASKLSFADTILSSNEIFKTRDYQDRGALSMRKNKEKKGTTTGDNNNSIDDNTAKKATEPLDTSTWLSLHNKKNVVQKYNSWHIPLFSLGAFYQLIQNARVVNAFDKGQDEAMATLAKEKILVIQGPPGTGKSFIGCRIVETYVRYKQLQSTGNIINCLSVDELPNSSLTTIAPSLNSTRANYVGPIVVITYKNHALDEFLLDLRRSGLWDADCTRFDNVSQSFPRGCRIVRIGGRSLEEDLMPYNLNSLMQSSQAAKAKIAPYRERIFSAMKRIEKLASEINYLSHGRVPKTYFDAWLTEEQGRTLTYEQRGVWLSGKTLGGVTKTTISGDNTKENKGGEDTLPDPKYYLALLQSRWHQLADTPLSTEEIKGMQAAAAAAIAARKGENEDLKRSIVFGDIEKEMKTWDAAFSLPFTGNDAEDGSVVSSSTVAIESNGSFIGSRLTRTAMSAEHVTLAKNPPQCPASVNPQALSLWSLTPVQRHHYYVYLIQRSISAKAKEYLALHDQLRILVTLRSHAQDEAKLDLLQQADVIGITTTGCAINQSLLRSLRPRILVAEEAAEVLESQLVACMTDSLTQLVLIGDHFQLRPRVETFELDKHNKMNVSLFERLAQSIQPILLVEQRRMHPAISRLIRPFYDKQGLIDHPSVNRPFIDSSGIKHFNNVPGLQQSVFFWTHDNVEENAETGLSKINTLEINLCLILVKHFMTQGVSPSSITVITPYLGQRRAIAAILKANESAAVRSVNVNTVDMFQGDENDIIILSLVRTQKLTDFMRIRNRMIVACSRAKHALIILGNEGLLRQSEHWSQVVEMLNSESCLGPCLPITISGTKALLLQSGSIVAK